MSGGAVVTKPVERESSGVEAGGVTAAPRHASPAPPLTTHASLRRLEDWTGYLYSLARRLDVFEVDDAVQAGRLAVLEHLDRVDQRRTAAEGRSWLSKWAMKAMRAQRDARRYALSGAAHYATRGQLPVGTWTRRALELARTHVPNPDESCVAAAEELEHAELLEDLRARVAELDPLERQVIELWRDGETLREIARRFHRCPNRISKIHRRALDELRARLEP